MAKIDRWLMTVSLTGLMCLAVSCARQGEPKTLSLPMADSISRAFVQASPVVKDVTGSVRDMQRTTYREMYQPRPALFFWEKSRGYCDISYRVEGPEGQADVSVRSKYLDNFWEVDKWSMEIQSYRLSGDEDQNARDILRHDAGINEAFGTLFNVMLVGYKAIHEFPDPAENMYEDKLMVTYQVAGSRRTGQVRVDLQREPYGWSKIYCWILDENQPFEEMRSQTAPAL